MDDGLIIGKDEEEIEDLIQKLKEEFETTVTRQPEEFLGVEINKSKKKVKLTQTKYIKKILERFGLVQAKTVNTPIVKVEDAQEETGNLQEETEDDYYPYQEAVGSWESSLPNKQYKA